MLSLSSCWNYSTDIDIHKWLVQVKDMGFNAIELDYKISRSHLQQIHKTLPKLGLAVSSVHNFCPTPNDELSPRHVSNYYRLSSLDEWERKKAVGWTCYTIDTAVEFKAKAVVLHAGMIESDDIRSKKLFDLYKHGKELSAAFLQERERILKFRKKNCDPYLAVLEESLRDVMDYAYRKKIKIGLETRYYPTEIPNFQEIGMLLSLFERKGMGYWHDVGHAEMNSLLGITDHRDYLEAYGKYLIGVHLHGMEGIDDHLVPFAGDMNLTALMKFFDKSVIKVVETSASSVEEMREAVDRLKK
ncbi:MAG: sugar phosphate isomerase/epimerase [Candidatus Omnitrophica bacterium]|nr:sugar phosphate isomerase/epimerase [Candidatus Omnitrophota bacterium]